jgi:D-alanine-D-alanine ligase
MNELTVALLYGGVSSEREVSINSANQVFEALDREKYRVLRYDTKTDLPRLVADAPGIDAALIILHGPYGEDGTVQGLLDLLGIPYQGSGVLGSAVAMNKLLSKQLFQGVGLPTPPYVAVRKQDPMDPRVLESRLGLPLVVKPVEGGSSIGMSIVRSIGDLADALAVAFDHGEDVLVESLIEGIELTVGVLGNQRLEALPVIQIIPDKGYAFFDYKAKYIPGASREICPAPIEDALAQKAQTYAMMAHGALFCRGYSRSDMILRGREIYVLETNTIPGMTATSLLPLAARTAGIPFGALLDRLIALGMEARGTRGQRSEVRSQRSEVRSQKPITDNR